ncbi:MAG: hypothetical protein UV01_C0004G0080 [Parcubacteria group bacterium GW2011_GWA2_42_14]|nr:MAG: hypothetical protein UV01_C0004G0080 [Parcubacteria group bacterium GW2011_GWA2_42_14]
MKMNDLFLNFKILLSFWDIIKRRDFILGKAVKDFEKKLALYLEAPYVLGVASCTDALILSLKALGIGHGDEVIVPAVSFFSTAGAVSWVNAKPVFVDIEEKSFNINSDLIEKVIMPKTKAIIVAHLAGRMAALEKISALTGKYNLYLIEDAAQTLGAKYKNRHIGYYADLACLSFNPQKILSAYGDGGAIVTGQTALAEKISMMRMYGANGYKEVSFRHPIAGVSSRLSSFQAAVLNIKLDQLNKIIEKWRKNYFLYSELLRGVDSIVLPETPSEDYYINGYRFIILTKKRDELLKYLRDNRVDARSHYSVPLPYLGAFEYLNYKKGDFPVAEKFAEESLALPLSHRISESEMRHIADLIRKFFEVIE